MVAAIDRSPAFEIEEFLSQERAKDLLRFTTAGSVDDGKSTLIGRLLYDSQSIYEDQLKAVTKASVNRSAGPIDFSLLTDGLRAEREQGITIDVAYRYFATARRKFIIADTPGHEQYTRNMATGASTADLAIILIDARNGVLAQSRRHASIAALLGIPNFASSFRISMPRIRIFFPSARWLEITWCAGAGTCPGSAVPACWSISRPFRCTTARARPHSVFQCSG